jgi:catechol 2,3-dioxygenase
VSTASAPIEIDHVVLTVHDLPGVAEFYQRVLGLAPLSQDKTVVRMGAGGRLLLELRGDAAARQSTPQEAGLFHTAFLLPDRAALARWLVHAAELRVPLQGASDHLVSEAIYLADPEGNGIEVYADRPRSAWHDANGNIRMATERLNLNALAATADAPWEGAPDSSVIGHVHLQVGDVPAALAFWRDTVGMAVMAEMPSAAFLGSGGYHHHIASNVWNSRGAGARRQPATGLTELVLAADAAEHARFAKGPGVDLRDPWGTAISIRAKAA